MKNGFIIRNADWVFFFFGAFRGNSCWCPSYFCNVTGFTSTNFNDSIIKNETAIGTVAASFHALLRSLRVGVTQFDRC